MLTPAWWTGWPTAVLLGHPVNDLIDWVRSRALWIELQNQNSTGKYSMQVYGVEVADLIVCSYLRFKPSPEFDVKDPFVKRLVWLFAR